MQNKMNKQNTGPIKIRFCIPKYIPISKRSKVSYGIRIRREQEDYIPTVSYPRSKLIKIKLKSV